MDMFAARPGDIIVAKIDLKNGALAIVPSDWTDVAVTGHFAVYEPDRSQLIPEYLHLLVQTKFFKAHLWRNKVGAEGRKEVKLDFLEAEAIPLHSLPVQRKLVAAWEAARKEVVVAEANIARLERDIETRFLADLGLKVSKKITLPKVFAVQWKDFLRWSLSYNQHVLIGIDITRSKYTLASIGSVAEMIQYGTSKKANTAGDGTPIIRMNNLLNGVLNLQNLKHIRLNPKEMEKLTLLDGDILFNRTNSKELVGKCATFHKKGIYVYASYLIRVRMDKTKANADYVTYALNSPIGRQQIDALSRQIIGQANINSEELRSLQIPVPSLPVQQSIMKRVEAKRNEIAKLKARIQTCTETAKAEIEAMILGTKPVKQTKK